MPDFNIDDLKYAQGPAKLATPADIDKDEIGITDPNLHRRIDEDLTPLEPEQVEKDTHSLLVAGTNSYRHTTHYYHDEESTTSEIP
jgi:hypothetical protein